jgi:uncharacterized protein YaiI (UPF0178 family)
MTNPTIWIDGDAAPKGCKEFLYKLSQRTKIPVILVANSYHQTPRITTVSTIKVGSGADVADDYIAEHCNDGDLVITADIPLAARIIEAKGTVIRFRGETLTEANVKQRLAMRDFMDDLRGDGVMTGGPSAYGPKEKQKFANSVDRWVQKHR